MVVEHYDPLLWEYGTKCPAELTQRSQAPLEVSLRPHSEVSAALQVPCSLVQRSQQLQNLTNQIGNLVASWMHLHYFRWSQDHLKMLLRSLRAHCKAPGGPGSIWKYLEALLRATWVSGRFACGFQTDLHFADVSPISSHRSLSGSHLYHHLRTRC